MESIDLIDADLTPLFSSIPVQNHTLEMFDRVIQFHENKIKPTLPADAHLLFDSFKTGSRKNKISLVNKAGFPIAMLSPLTTQSNPMYVGRGNLDVPMKEFKPKDERQGAWTFEPDKFAYSSGVEENNHNKHVIRFNEWTRRVSIWLFWESLVSPLFEAEWKTKILKKHPLIKLQALIDLTSELEELWTDYSKCFLPKKPEKQSEDRVLMTAPMMHPRVYDKKDAKPEVKDPSKPAAIRDLEASFVDDLKRQTHSYNKLPIYNQFPMGKFTNLTWEQRAEIPSDLVQIAEFSFHFTDTGQGNSKLALQLRGVFLIGKSPIAPPTFGRPSGFTVTLPENDPVFQALVNANKRKHVEDKEEPQKKEKDEQENTFVIPAYDDDFNL